LSKKYSFINHHVLQRNQIDKLKNKIYLICHKSIKYGHGHFKRAETIQREINETITPYVKFINFKSYKKDKVYKEIKFDEYYRCYCIGGKHVRIMPYEPRNQHHLRYVADFSPSPERYKEMEDIVLRICKYLGYDFNTVEMAVRNGVPYAIDFCNPAPDADVKSVGQENFEWVVEHAAKMAVERAQAQQAGKDNLTWVTFVSTAANANQKVASAKIAKPKKTTTSKKEK
jgi:hypothetical protein